jgi:3-deoxy-7-phosphoheptulonate synthase
MEKWKKSSWRGFLLDQQPDWPNYEELTRVTNELSHLPSLVFSGETRRLKDELARVNLGDNFILQVGNCAESFDDCNGPKIHNFVRIVLEMAIAIQIQSGKQVIKMGRIAGQYAKPRSSNYEMFEGKQLPVYRGDIINDNEPNLNSRIPKPKRMLDAYFRSAATLNLIRAFTQGGYSDIKNLSDWKEHFFSKEVSDLEIHKKLETYLSSKLKGKLQFAEKAKLDDIIYTSHESLLLDYEESFARIDTTTNDWYSTSAHSLWIGDRTRQLQSAHVEFVRGIGNPIGIKVGPNIDFEEIISVIKKVNPSNERGKLMLICRMGKNKINQILPSLIQIVKKNDLEVIWCCDPMHGNTHNHMNLKFRSLDDILEETKCFFEICKCLNVVPGGIHLEITGERVTECIGGINGLTVENLNDNYLTKVDPRLNAAQAIEASFIVGGLI